MNKLQAAMKDKSAKTWRERTVMFKVGSAFKGCRHCGEIVIDITKSGKEKERWTSGFNVYRSYRPWETKWTWRCDECGAVDWACWDKSDSNYLDLGREPILGSVKAKTNAKILRYSLGKDKVKMEPRARVSEHVDRIKMLEEKIKQLEMLKGGR